MGIILCRNYIYLNLHEYAILSDMKRMTLCFLLLSAFLFSGCDFFRTLAGRPTSKDIENIQIAALKKEKAALQSKYDLVRKELNVLKDSLSAIDSIGQYGGTVLNPTRLGSLYTTKLEARYYIIIGSFSNRVYAEMQLQAARKAGYQPALISFRNGMMAVGVCPANNIKAAFDALKKVRKEKFCPSDVWVLLNE